MARNIPQRLSKKCNRLPWIPFTLKAKMCQRKSIYNTAKHLQTDNAWSKYCKLKNEINKEIKEAHEKYQRNLFDSDDNNKCFWKYVKQLCKDNIGVPTLKHNNQVITEPKEKAYVLNKHFDSIFTDEDLYIPKCDDNIYGSVPPINFTVNGIQNQLNVLDINTASGPDNISGCIL